MITENVNATADTSYAEVLLKPEDVFGEFKTDGSAERLRITGEGLTVNRDYVISDQISPDGQYSSMIPTKLNTAGDINFEFSALSFDRLISGALRRPWLELAPTNENYEEVTVDSTASTFVFSGTIRPSMVPGQYIRATNFIDDNNNGYYLIKSIENVGNTVKWNVSPAPRVTEQITGASNYITLKGDVVYNGTDFITFSLEKRFTDANRFINFKGMCVDTFKLNLKAGEKVTGSVSFMGQNGELTDATAFSGDISDVNDLPVMVASAADHGLFESGNNLRAVDSLTIDISNSLRLKHEVGNLVPFDIGTSRISVTGSISQYFEDKTLFENYVKHNKSDILFATEEAGGYKYAIYLPEVTFQNNTPSATAADEDVMVSGDYQATRNSVTNSTIVISRIKVV